MWDAEALIEQACQRRNRRQMFTALLLLTLEGVKSASADAPTVVDAADSEQKVKQFLREKWMRVDVAAASR